MASLLGKARIASPLSFSNSLLLLLIANSSLEQENKNKALKPKQKAPFLIFCVFHNIYCVIKIQATYKGTRNIKTDAFLLLTEIPSFAVQK